MISEFQELSDKIDQLAEMTQALRRENAQLRQANAALVVDNLGYQKRLSEAHDRVDALLDKKMSAIRDGGKIKGNDRIAVMAALGMAAEFLSAKAPQGPLSDMSILDVQQKMSAMHQVLDSALTPQETLF